MQTAFMSPSCDLEDGSIIGRTAESLYSVVDWAQRHSQSEFALGVLAAMNYVLCRDENTPEKRQGQPDVIRKASEPPEWVKHYIRTFRPELLSVTGEEIPAFRGDSDSEPS